MRVFDFPQYSAEWWAVRRGVPTASEFKSILTPKTCKPAASAEGYLCQLVGDVYGLDYPPVEESVSAAMRRGTEREPEARRWLELNLGRDIRQVGFCLSDDGRFGCSPDGIIDGEAGVELKCPTAKTHVEYLLGGVLPDDHRPQVHGSLIVTGLPAWWFCSYCPGLPALLIRATPNDYTETLRRALEQFHDRLTAMLQRFAPQEDAA